MFNFVYSSSPEFPFLHHRRSSSNFSASGRIDLRQSSQASQDSQTDDTMSDVGSFASGEGVRCGGGSTGCASVDRALLQHLIHCDCLLQVCVCRCGCGCVWGVGWVAVVHLRLTECTCSFIPPHFTFCTCPHVSACTYTPPPTHTPPPPPPPPTHTHAQHLQSAGPLNYKLRTGLLKLQQEAEIIAELLNIAAEPDIPVVVEQSESSSAEVCSVSH